MNILNIGGKYGHGARTRFYPGKHFIRTVDIVTGWDVTEKGLPDGVWDVVLMNNFLEHVENTDFVMKEVVRVMGYTSKLDITVPNMASWFNKILLWCGFMPHCCEVSTASNFGKLFKTELSGHVRSFTHGALRDMLEFYGFRIIRRIREPWWANPVFGALDWLFSFIPTLESHTRFICELRHD